MSFERLIKANNNAFIWPLKGPYAFKNGLPIRLPSGSSTMMELHEKIWDQIRSEGKIFGYGGYAEERDVYRNPELFKVGEKRTIHLGLDIWAKEGIPVYLPIEGIIHSFRDNDMPGNYGPTIITQHTLQGEEFYLLFGHLSRDSLNSLQPGMHVDQGAILAKLGSYEENGNWPPHLHYQIIKDLGSYEGDYPGVASRSELDFYLNNCPDPMILYNTIHHESQNSS